TDAGRLSNHTRAREEHKAFEVQSPQGHADGRVVVSRATDEAIHNGADRGRAINAAQQLPLDWLQVTLVRPDGIEIAGDAADGIEVHTRRRVRDPRRIEAGA